MLVVRLPSGVLGALPLAHYPNQLQQFRSGFDLPPGTWDFAFLSSRAFFLTSADASGSIELFTFKSRESGAPDIISPKHVVSLRLPELVEGRDVRNFSTHSAPFLGGDITKDVPFASSQDDRIHVMTLTYGDRSPRFHLFIKNSFLLGLATAEGASGLKQVLPWEEWGPDNTRFFEHNVQFQWLRYVHGHRVILPPVSFGTEPGEDSSVMFVMDFHVHPKRTHDPCDDLPYDEYEYVLGSESNWQVSDDPTTIEPNRLFKHPVTSKLPYAVSHRTGDFKYTGFMIDDARIVGMKVRVYFFLRVSGIYLLTPRDRILHSLKDCSTISMSSHSKDFELDFQSS